MHQLLAKGASLHPAILQQGLLAILLSAGTYLPLAAQQQFPSRAKLFDTWVYLEHKSAPLTGALYQTLDSSIQVSDSRIRTDYPGGRMELTSIPYPEIKSIQLRRNNSIARGGLMGGTIGFVGGLVMYYQQTNSLVFSSILALAPAAITGGIGALAGCLKISIPLYGNQDAFNLYKPKLNHYSYLKNSTISSYQHESYLAWFTGPSFIQGDFKEQTSDTLNDKVRSGYGAGFLMRIKLKPYLGLSLAMLNNQYEAGFRGEIHWWQISGLVLGPSFSIPLAKKIQLEVNPSIGFLDAGLYRDEQLLAGGDGITGHLASSLRFNVFPRWCALVETSYTFSNIRFPFYPAKLYQSYNLSFGAGYRFR